MKKHQLLLLLVTMISVCILGLTACDSFGGGSSNAHKHTLTHVDVKSATCQEDGNIEYWYCTDCHNFYSDAAAQTEITEADTLLKKDQGAHAYGEWTVVKEPTIY